MDAAVASVSGSSVGGGSSAWAAAEITARM